MRKKTVKKGAKIHAALVKINTDKEEYTPFPAKRKMHTRSATKSQAFKKTKVNTAEKGASPKPKTYTSFDHPKRIVIEACFYEEPSKLCKAAPRS